MGRGVGIRLGGGGRFLRGGVGAGRTGGRVGIGVGPFNLSVGARWPRLRGGYNNLTLAGSMFVILAYVVAITIGVLAALSAGPVLLGASFMTMASARDTAPAPSPMVDRLVGYIGPWSEESWGAWRRVTLLASLVLMVVSLIGVWLLNRGPSDCAVDALSASTSSSGCHEGTMRAISFGLVGCNIVAAGLLVRGFLALRRPRSEPGASIDV